MKSLFAFALAVLSPVQPRKMTRQKSLRVPIYITFTLQTRILWLTPRQVRSWPLTNAFSPVTRFSKRFDPLKTTATSRSQPARVSGPGMSESASFQSIR